MKLMRERTYTTVDKSEWGPGPWQDEPDKIQWKDEDTGLPCLAKRGPMGAWCGYVAISNDHPLYEISYDELNLEVHGGLTYSSHCQEEGDESTTICHIPEPGESDDVWWLGFDCCHAGDYMPVLYERETKLGLEPISRAFGVEDAYRDLEYVRRECAHLAQQLVEAR